MTRAIEIIHHGATREPVMVIDDFCADPGALIEDAAMLAWQRVGDHYPGVRAEIPAALVRRLLAPVAAPIADLFDLPEAPAQHDAWYSLVTTPPQALRPIQRLPHFDGLGRERIALLLFLSREAYGGTSFYRHRASGNESINAANHADYTRQLEAELARDGMPPPAYISGDTALFERIAHYPARFNRALVYRGHSLHCADIPADLKLSADPLHGRLTANLFLIGATS